MNSAPTNTHDTTTLVARRLAAASPTSRTLLGIADVALAGAIVLVPWCMGGRHPLGELVLVVLSLLAGGAWWTRRILATGSLGWRRSGAELVFLGALALLLVQVMPLPGGLLHLLSPRIGSLLPLWQESAGAAQVGTWNQWSMTPAATRASIVVLLAYGVLFFTLVSRLETLSDVERTLRIVAVSAAVMAGFGLVQYLTSNGRFLWCYQHPYRDTHGVVKGMFINQNHFAHLLALGIGPLIACLVASLHSASNAASPNQARVGWHSLGYALALVILLFAGLMSLSRGGVAALAIAGGMTGLMLWRGRLITGRIALGGAAVLLLTACSLGLHGHDRVAERMDDYASGSLNDLDRNGGRRLIWQTDAAAVKDFWRIGAGVGSHREVYPMYFSRDWDTEFTHAENGYLQVALEAGLPGVALLLSALALVGWWCVNSLRHAKSARWLLWSAAVSAGLLASAAHAVADFAWYIPGCMAVTLVLAACALRLFQMQTARAPQASRDPARLQPASTWASARWLACPAAGVLAVVGGTMVYDRACATMAAPHWDAYLEFALSDPARIDGLEPSREVIEHLREVVYWTPDDSRAQLRLAGASLRRFERMQSESSNAIPLNQIRDAALASKFATRAALDEWLSRAVGDNRRLLDAALWHTRRAISECPLQGEAYTYLAQLCFLEGAGPQAKPPLVDQALRVRPYGGGVLLFAGSEAALAGDLASAIEYWRRAFHAGRDTQRELIDLWLAGQMPLDLMFRVFEPDLHAMRLMNARYTKIYPDEQLKPLLERYALAARQELEHAEQTEQVPLLLEVHNVYRRLGLTHEQIAAARRAVDLAPQDYAARSALGRLLLQQGAFAEAETHLRWCAQRESGDESIQQLWSIAIKGRLEQAPATLSGLPASTR